jgi:Ca-activated chloride channel homolog
MTFGAPQWLLGLLALPVLVALFVRSERKGAERLRDFVSPRLLPQLAGNVNRFRRKVRLSLQLLGLALALVSLAQPRWGYTFENAKRKGLDLFIAIDTSRSMLSNDVQPNRLERVKLAAQDLINQLQGDRVGLIAFAGWAFVQAPLTIDYDAVVEKISDLDTKTVPEGGTNISGAINLADTTYGKSAVGNRGLIIFTDGEELSGDAVKTAKAAADAGVRIFTVGVGTPEGSLIPINGEDGGAAFVKDAKGRVVKSKLDEKRLHEIAEATGGFYLRLENGPRSMEQLFTEGLAKMQAAEIDVRLARRPIERYEWPLGAAVIALALSFLIRERKRVREAAPVLRRPPVAATAAVTALVLFSLSQAFAAAPGLDAYRDGKFTDAYQEFQQTLKTHPQTSAADKLQFDSGAAAYKMKNYGKALESFSQALLSPDIGLQSKAHYNLGNTLYEHGDAQQSDDKKLTDWMNALQHYEQTLKSEPQNREAKDNYDYVKKKIEELKKKQQQQPPPKKQQKNEKQDKTDKENQQQQNQQQQNQQNQQSQAQNQSGTGENQQPENKQDQSQAKNEQQKNQQTKSGASPSPSPSEGEESGQPSPSPGEERKDNSSGEKQPEQSPTPGDNEKPRPSPSPGKGEGSGERASPSPAPEASPRKKLAGEVKAAPGDKSKKPDENVEIAEAEAEKEGQMSERQAEALLQSMKDEEARVQLDERKAARHVYNDW